MCVYKILIFMYICDVKIFIKKLYKLYKKRCIIVKCEAKTHI